MFLIPSWILAVAYLLAAWVCFDKKHSENIAPRLMTGLLYVYLTIAPQTPIEEARLYARYFLFLLPAVEVLWWGAYKFGRRSRGTS